MKTSPYLQKLQAKYKLATHEASQKEKSTKFLALRAQQILDRAEAQKIIGRSENEIDNAATAGNKEYVVCVLRNALHFPLDQNPNQGIIGKMLRKHFMSLSLKVEFRTWTDPMRIQELDEDSGYEVVVSGWAK